jgi:hypothetical protein
VGHVSNVQAVEVLRLVVYSSHLAWALLSSRVSAWQVLGDVEAAPDALAGF